MRRFNSFESQRFNSWIDEFNQIVSFINENSEQNNEKYKQIKIKDPQNAIFLGESKYGPVAINKETFNDVRTLIVGQPGSGKSYFTRRYIESLLEHSIPVFVLDPEGEWLTLKSGYDLILLGKNKDKDCCDIEINEDNLESVIEKCLINKCSAIINLSEWTEDEEKQKLVTIFNTYLIDKVPAELRQVLNVIYEEASIFARKGDSSVTNMKCKLSLKEVAAQGRKRGISSTFITQRITFLSPDIISQCNTYLFGQTEGTADVERVANLLGIKKSKYHIIKELEKGQFIAYGRYFCHYAQVKDTLVIFKADKVKTPHLDLMQRLKYQIPEASPRLKNIISSVSSKQIINNKNEANAEEYNNKKQPAICEANNKIARFEQIVSCLGSISLKNLYVLAIEKFNQVEAQFEITKWLRGNSREYIQVNDEIYTKEKNTKMRLENAEWFLEKWKKKIDDDKYWKLIAYLFRNDNERNSLKDISQYLEITIKELNDLYLKYVGLNLIYAKETELFLNDIFFHPILNNVEMIETNEDDESDLIESFDNDFEEEFEEIDNYND